MSKFGFARLVFCVRCGEHTHILFSDGSKTEELKFIDEVHRAIAQALLDGHLCNDETDALFVQLSKSKMRSYNFMEDHLSILDEIYTLGAIEIEMRKCVFGKSIN